MLRLLIPFVRPMITGLLAVLPIVLTLLLIGWVATYITTYLGPGSWFGSNLSRIGAFVVDDRLAYVIGFAIVLGILYVVGLLVQTRLRIFWSNFLDETLGRLPLIGTIYKTLSRFIQLLERRDDVDVKSMSPVWCFFSDERRTAVLGLLPSDQPVEVEGRPYRIVMVPTAPVPFGGGLFFLPEEWVRPASFGVEGLTNIYVSMGVTAPDYMGAIKDAKKKPAKIITRDAPPPLPEV
ncbi:DUF502 domain-containing protein [Acuticoccus mangrovi]|uniref:DUF502 domain-containing protein n=1 Tax=Acuticoccus mangrovi TaxID=2796142 RepID=A0A934ILX5_9HYPH|nr:DUF502 domain-containing protein [Acuticoccus mangrovi]